jgi:hypothetical protein
LNGIKLRFVTGGAWANKAGGEGNDSEGENDFGDFEDLQTGQVFGGKAAAGKKGKRSDDDSDDEEANEKRNIEIDNQLRVMNAGKKADFKAKFDKSYDSKKGGGKGGSDDEGGKGEGEEEDDEARIKREDEELIDMSAEEKKYLEAARRAQEELRERNRREFGEEGDLARQQQEGVNVFLFSFCNCVHQMTCMNLS